ncbi:MAG: hypothetical protein N3G76_01270, partial [Candidatus Micrarchaeota archaeon]|nr:hypothetical protein [Candidatus Micrarchaeota archaeon]
PQNVIYKTVLKEVIDDKCCSKRDQLQEELNGCKDNNLKLNTDLQELEKLKSKEKYYAFKLELMNKVDRIFDGIGVKPKNGGRGPEDELYKKTIRPWFEKGIMNDDPVMIILVINMGGELLGQEIKDGKVVGLKQPMSNKEFNELFENGNLAYLDGVSLDNNAGNRKDGMKGAAYEYYLKKYKLIEEALKNSP